MAINGLRLRRPRHPTPAWFLNTQGSVKFHQRNFSAPPLTTTLVPMYYVSPSPAVHDVSRMTEGVYHTASQPYMSPNIGPSAGRGYLASLVYPMFAPTGTAPDPNQNGDNGPPQMTAAPLLYSPLAMLQTAPPAGLFSPTLHHSLRMCTVPPPEQANMAHVQPRHCQNENSCNLGGTNRVDTISSNENYCHRSGCMPLNLRHSSSRVTSVNAEPGSIASLTTQPPSVKQVEESEGGGRSPGSSDQGNKETEGQDGDSSGTSNPYDDSSYCFSSSSGRKTNKSEGSMKSSQDNNYGKMEDMNWEKSSVSDQIRPVRKVAPWPHDVAITPELALQYRLQERLLEDILVSDNKLLEKLTQPSMVNDQLNQLYMDLENEGMLKQLIIEEGITSSSDSCPDEPTKMSRPEEKKKKKRFLDYEKIAILYEENAPLPPPVVEPAPCT